MKATESIPMEKITEINSKAQRYGLLKKELKNVNKMIEGIVQTDAEERLSFNIDIYPNKPKEKNDSPLSNFPKELQNHPFFQMIQHLEPKAFAGRRNGDGEMEFEQIDFPSNSQKENEKKKEGVSVTSDSMGLVITVLTRIKEEYETKIAEILSELTKYGIIE